MQVVVCVIDAAGPTFLILIWEASIGGSAGFASDSVGFHRFFVCREENAVDIFPEPCHFLPRTLLPFERPTYIPSWITRLPSYMVLKA